MPWGLVTALVTLALTPVAANFISQAWQEARKQRDLDVQSLVELYALYGEFCAVWKWARESGAIADPKTPQQDLLERACAAEGRMESLLVRVATERDLEAQDIERLGAFRQVFQQLRESLQPDAHERKDGLRTWTSAASPGYVALKTLMIEVAAVLNQPRRRASRLSPAPKRPTAGEAARELLRVTSNRYEHPTWLSIGLSEPAIRAYRDDLEAEVGRDSENAMADQVRRKRSHEAAQEIKNIDAALDSWVFTPPASPSK